MLGAVLDGVGTGGIEEAYQNLLDGSPGQQIAARDSKGVPIPGESVMLSAPVPGGDVRLTLDLGLQEIAQEALAQALATTKAKGGDLIITDPSTGEILALVSARGSHMDALAAVNAPYEPGSTLKPFTVAAVLDHGVGRLTDSINTGNGTWEIDGRTLSDTHVNGKITLAEALKVSSNVGVAMAAEALSPSQQYEALRDFGFGVPTGLPLPGEASGLLRRPERWTPASNESMAIGY